MGKRSALGKAARFGLDPAGIFKGKRGGRKGGGNRKPSAPMSIGAFSGGGGATPGTMSQQAASAAPVGAGMVTGRGGGGKGAVRPANKPVKDPRAGGRRGKMNSRGSGGREGGGGFRNRAFGMGREQRGFGMGRQGFQGGGGNSAMGMGGGMNERGRPTFASQQSFVEGNQAYGRGGTGGYGRPGDRNAMDLLGGQGRGQQGQRDQYGQLANSLANRGGGRGRRKTMRNRRSRFQNQQRSAQGGGGMGAAMAMGGGGGGFGGHYSSPQQQAYQGKSFSKKMGTQQGAFRLPPKSQIKK